MQNYETSKPQIPGWASWPAIIIAFLLFWPVGIFFLWKRVSIDRKAAMVSGKGVKIFGWVLVSISAIGIFAGLTSGFAEDDFGYILFFALAGAVLVLFGRRIANNANNIKKYIDIIVNNEIYSLDEIGRFMKIPYEKVKTDLQNMIDKQYFPSAYIDESSREIVLAKARKSQQAAQQNISQAYPAELVVATCGGCGANNKIPSGTVKECEYCGSPIKA